MVSWLFEGLPFEINYYNSSNQLQILAVRGGSRAFSFLIRSPPPKSLGNPFEEGPFRISSFLGRYVVGCVFVLFAHKRLGAFQGPGRLEKRSHKSV